MIPLLATCCCRCVSVRTGSLILGGLQAFVSFLHIIINILGSTGAVSLLYGGGGLYITFFIVDFFGLVVNILLIVGIEKRKPTWILPAVIHYFVGIAFVFVIFAANCVHSVDSYGVAVFFVTTLVLTAICTYFWLIVYSYYRHLKNELNFSSDNVQETEALERANNMMNVYHKV